MHWTEPYIGLPWQERGLARDGLACWGLVRLVYAEHLGIIVPDYAAEVTSLEERAEVAAVFAGGTMTGPWVSVPEGAARPFDVVVFRRAGLDAHAGLVVEPGRMLHITSGHDSAIVDYRSGRWAPRLAGVYRHIDLMNARPQAGPHCGPPSMPDPSSLRYGPPLRQGNVEMVRGISRPSGLEAKP